MIEFVTRCDTPSSEALAEYLTSTGWPAAASHQDFKGQLTALIYVVPIELLWAPFFPFQLDLFSPHDFRVTSTASTRPIEREPITFRYGRTLLSDFTRQIVGSRVRRREKTRVMEHERDNRIAEMGVNARQLVVMAGLFLMKRELL